MKADLLKFTFFIFDNTDNLGLNRFLMNICKENLLEILIVYLLNLKKDNTFYLLALFHYYELQIQRECIFSIIVLASNFCTFRNCDIYHLNKDKYMSSLCIKGQFLMQTLNVLKYASLSLTLLFCFEAASNTGLILKLLKYLIFIHL